LYDDWMMAADYGRGSKGTRWGESHTAYNETSAPSWYQRIKTDAISAAGVSVVSLIHENKLEALKGGAMAWTWLGEARVSVAPVAHGDKFIFGSHDGWVHAINAADGSPVWSYLAAPEERKTVAYGQLESSWPLYGVVLDGGSVYYLAGRSTGIDDGMWAGALDASTGASKWRIRVARYDASKYAQYMNTPLLKTGGGIGYFGPTISMSNPSELVVGVNEKVAVTPFERGWFERYGVKPAVRPPLAGRGTMVDMRGRCIADLNRNGAYLTGFLAPGNYLFHPEGEGVDTRPIQVVRKARRSNY
jgi:hypothetical protein